MRSKARRRSRAVVGAVIGAAAVYGAHRGHRAIVRGLAGTMLAEVVPIEPPDVDPGGGGTQPGLLTRLDFDPHWDFQFGHPQFADLTDTVVNVLHNEWQGFSDFVEIEFDVIGTVFNLFDEAWGTGANFLGDVIQGAAQEAARLLGLATGEQVYNLAGYVRSTFDKIAGNINDAWHSIGDILDWAQWVDGQLVNLGELAWSVWSDLTAKLVDLVEQMNAALAQIEAQIADIGSQVAQLPNEIPEIDPGDVPAIIEHTVETLLPQTIVDVLPLVFPVIVGQVLANLPTTLAQLDPDAARRLADDEACCAANTDTLNKAKPDLDKLKDLLNLLSGLLLVGSMPEILSQIEAFLNGGGSDVESQLLGWLGLDQ